MATRKAGTSRSAKDGDGGTAAAAAPALDREFQLEGASNSVLVELGTRVAPASFGSGAPDPGVLKKLKDIVGADPVAVFRPPSRRDRVISPASMMRQPGLDPSLSRFVEFPVADAAAAGKLTKEIKAALAGDVTEVLPVPAAVPALGPARAERPPGEQPTPDLRALQGYLGPGPDGLGLAFGWQFPGGDGFGVTVLDIEGAWRLTHESLVGVRFNQWAGEMVDGAAWLEHGTAVVGALTAPRYANGITGVCPGARVGMVSAFEAKDPPEQKIASQIMEGISLLRPGDVILLELQRPGPATSYAPDADQKGYLPVEFWPDVRAAIASATAAGICVVAVAGNGGVDLDDPLYEGRFDRSRNDSGAILVGAGAPPGGAFGPVRSWLDFSNFGRRLDCQAWGQAVATAGYGDLWSAPGGDGDRTYTSRFMGTSSAAPLVAGLVACLQARHKLVYGVPIAPLLVRYALNVAGWPQALAGGAGEGRRIGNQPDLAQLFQLFGLLG